jgi:hypothetical protein
MDGPGCRSKRLKIPRRVGIGYSEKLRRSLFADLGIFELRVVHSLMCRLLAMIAGTKD